MITVLAAAALVLGVARLALFVALHVARSDYNIVEHAVSDYAVGRTRTLSRVMTWITAVLWLALAALAWAAFPQWNDLAVVVSCLIALAVLFAVLPFLPTDIEGTETTTVGRLHMLAAIAWFALSYSCMGNFTRLLESAIPALLAHVLLALSWVALASLVALVAALVIKPARRYAFGIAERIFILSITLFYTVLPIAVLAAS